LLAFVALVAISTASNDQKFVWETY